MKAIIEASAERSLTEVSTRDGISRATLGDNGKSLAEKLSEMIQIFLKNSKSFSS